MVGLFKALLPPLLLATYAAAQDSSTSFDILSPSSSIWWGALRLQAFKAGVSTLLLTFFNFFIRLQSRHPKM
jgi:hypothetical protein